MPSPIPQPGLLGRRSECQILDRLLEAVRRGESRAVVMRGEPGVGKTALLQYAIDSAVAGTWKAGYKPFGLAMGPKASDMTVCGATPEMKAKIDAIKKDIESGKIKVLEG